MLCKLHCLFNLTPLSSRLYRSFKRKIRYLGNRRNRNINEQQDKWKNTRDRQEEKIGNAAEAGLISNEWQMKYFFRDYFFSNLQFANLILFGLKKK